MMLHTAAIFLGVLTYASATNSRESLKAELQGYGTTAFHSDFLDTKKCPTVTVSNSDALKTNLEATGCKWIEVAAGTYSFERDVVIAPFKVIDGRGRNPTIARSGRGDPKPLQFINKQYLIVTGMIFEGLNKLPKPTDNWRTLYNDCVGLKKYNAVDEKCKISDFKNKPDKACICDVDNLMEKDTLYLEGSSNIWVHRNSFLGSGEALQFKATNASKGITISYNYFDSVYDVIMSEAAGQFSVHHNTYKNCNRRQPKVNNPDLQMHVWNDVVIDIGLGFEWKQGNMFNDNSYWLLNTQPNSQVAGCESACKATFVNVKQQLNGKNWKFDFTTCAASTYRPDYAYTVESDNCAGNSMPSKRKCTTSSNWFSGFIPTTNGAKHTAKSGAGSQ